MKHMKSFMNIILSICVLMFIFALDFGDVFSHGYFTDAIKYSQIYEGDIQGYVDLSKEDYSLTFTPIKRHFTGFVLYLQINQQKVIRELFNSLYRMKQERLSIQ